MPLLNGRFDAVATEDFSSRSVGIWKNSSDLRDVVPDVPQCVEQEQIEASLARHQTRERLGQGPVRMDRDETGSIPPSRQPKSYNVVMPV